MNIWDLQAERHGPEPRDFRVLMTVSNKEKWDGVRSHLEATLRFLTGDTLTFHFVQGKPAKTEFRFRRKNDGCVALFSGGLDSLAGVKWILDQTIMTSVAAPASLRRQSSESAEAEENASTRRKSRSESAFSMNNYLAREGTNALVMARILSTRILDQYLATVERRRRPPLLDLGPFGLLRQQNPK